MRKIIAAIRFIACLVLMLTACTESKPGVEYKYEHAQGESNLSIVFVAENLGLRNDAKSVSWDFGDESIKGEGNEITHTFRVPGTYRVTLKVVYTDNSEATNSSYITVPLQ